MKKYLPKLKVCLLLTIATILSTLEGYSQSSWAKGFGGAEDDIVKALTKGNDGSLYSVGTFAGTVDFDPGNAEFNLTSAGGTDMFIVKYSADGDFIRAARIGGITDDEATAIAVDKDGNCHITGFFQDKVDFNPDLVDKAEIVANGDYDIFVLKLDSSFKYIWAKKMAGTGFEQGNSIAVDNLGNVITCGDFAGETDFDPAVAEFKMTTQGLIDAYISKLDKDGNFVWAKQIKGNGVTHCNTIMIGENNDLLIGGSFDGKIDADPSDNASSLYTSKNLDGFVLRLDDEGGYSICYALTGPGDESINAGTYNLNLGTFIGEYSGKTNFNNDLGTDEYTSVGKSDVFVLVVDFYLGFLKWVKVFGSTENDLGKAITHDQNGNLYLAGEFSAKCDFNPGNAGGDLSPTGGSNIFLSTMKTNGDFVNASHYGGSTADYCGGVVVNQNVFIGGGYTGKLNFKSTSLESEGKIDALLLSDFHSLSSVNKNNLSQNIIVYPNPTNEKLNIDFEDNSSNTHVELYNSIGQKIDAKIIMNGSKAEIQMPEISGFYFVKLTNNNEAQTIKVFRK